jgi:glycine/D-amino acid oxidase-like deaminating enzyme
VTTAPGSAHLLAALMTGSAPEFDAAPYAPRGLLEMRA